MNPVGFDCSGLCRVMLRLTVRCVISHVCLRLLNPHRVLCWICSGLAQCAELCWQLRGEAGKRQVPGAKVALQHNIGIGGAVVVTLYRMGFPQEAR